MSTLSAIRPAPARVDPAVGWAPLLVVLAGTFVTFLDFFIVNVGLPSIDADLAASPAVISLVVAGYGLTFAAGMITGGRLGDLYGRRRLFVLGLALFTVTSLGCGIAPSAAALVIARVLQGAAAALLTPQVLAILGTTYLGRRRDTAFAAFGIAMGLAGVLGQLIGGALIAADVAGLGWRTIFLINVPVGVLAIPFALRVVPESRGRRSALDLTGVLLGTLTITAVVAPLVEGRQQGWPWWTWLSLTAAPFLFLGFVAQQRRRGTGGRGSLVELALFRARSFGLGSAVAFTFSAVPSSFFFVLALYLQDGRGYSALRSGVIFTAVGAGYFLAIVVAGPLAARIGPRILAGGSVAVAAGAVLLVEQARATSLSGLAPGLAFIGLGIGLVLVPLSAMVLRDVDPDHAGSAAGLLNTAQQVGGAVGVAVIGMVYFAGASPAGAFTACLWVITGLVALAGAMSALLRTA